MEKIKRYALFLLLMTAGVACQKDAPKEAGDPQMDLRSKPEQAYYGDSIPIVVDVRDASVPLSTLKATLYYGDAAVSQQTFRTKGLGTTVEGKIFAPYYPNLKDGTATLELTLQNIHFTKQTHKVDLPVSRPKWNSLQLILEDGTEYTLGKQGDSYTYSATEDFPVSFKAYLKSPAYGKVGNELTFGMDNEGKVTADKASSPIFFAGKAGKYEVSFDALTYEYAPLIVVHVGDDLMQLTNDGDLFVDRSMKQGETFKITGLEPDVTYFDPDFFAASEDGTYTFLPVSGDYRIVIDHIFHVLSAVRLSGGEEATLQSDGTGALWGKGWGLAYPALVRQIGWDEHTSYCVAEIRPKVFQVTGEAGPEHSVKLGQKFRTDYLDFKFFHQNGWGGEFKSYELTPGTDAFLKVQESGNINLADGATLTEGQLYRLTIDLTKGVDAPVLDFKVL